MVEPTPLKTATDAATDEALEYIAGMRADMEADPGAAVFIEGAGIVAEVLSGQFPAVPQLGRIVTSVTQAAKSVDAGLARTALSGDLASVMTILALAGEQLDRESREEVPGGE